MNRISCSVPVADPGWKLIACDLDGTLVGRDNRVNLRDRDALHTAIAAGVKVAICTGRNYGESLQVLEALDLDGPGVFVNGATICEVRTGRSLHQRYLKIDQVRDIMDVLGSQGHSVLALANAGETAHCRYLFSDHGTPHPAAVAWWQLTETESHPWPGLSAPVAASVVRLGTVTDAGLGAGLMAAIQERFGDTVECHNLESIGFGCDVVEVFDSGVSKWSGILDMCQRLDISPESVVTIGDDNNDIPMLRSARLSFAMATANAATRASAHQMTASQRESGVAKAIEGLLAGHWAQRS